MPEGPRPFRLLLLPKPTAKPTASATAKPTAKPRLSPALRVSASRLATFRAGGSGGAAERGVVVQAVLLTVMVTTIGLLAVASRVASSRQGAAASSLAAAARQAAEFGFSEIVAEMNRDAKAYLWVTPYANWQSVSDADLQACGIHTSTAPAANPIPGASNGATPSVSLPGSSELSYELTGYQAPRSVDSTSTSTSTSLCATDFGNLRGGTATLTVVGRAQRPSGDQTSFTLRRSVSVRRAEPVFRRTIFQGPATQVNLTGSDSRFPAFPTAAGLLGVSVTSVPDVTCSLPTPSIPGGSIYTCNGESFNNSINSIYKFPYTSSTGSGLATGCSPNSANQIVCQFSSLTLSDGVQMVVDVKSKPVTMPVNIFVNGSISISSNANLCSDSPPSPPSSPSPPSPPSPTVTSCLGTAATTSPPAAATPPATGNWSSLRLFGKASGASCDQQVQLNGSTAINLRNTFLWFPYGRLTYPAALTSLPAGLVGWVCEVAPPATTTIVNSLPPNQVFDGLFDPLAVPINGIFRGGANQPGAIRFVYRGFGSQEQRLQP
jgi:hypothetical protein